MKLLALLILAVSVATNAALVAAFISKPSLAPVSVRGLFRPDSAQSGAKRTTLESAPNAAPAANPSTFLAPFLANFQSEDLGALVARLRAAGFPSSAIRAIVDAELQHRFGPRIEALRRSIDEVPFWRGDPGFFTGTSKLFEQMNQLSRERARALREVLGPEAFAYAGIDPTEAQRRQFGDLSPGKVAMVQRINDDYAEMTSQIRAAMQGITLPEDREKLALLEREKRADLAGFLSPEELADYEMRSSPVTSRLRTALTIMDASEDEFRRIYTAYSPHSEVLFPTYSSGVVFSTSDASNPRQIATQKALEDLKQTLGPDRFAQYQRANDRDFQQLYQLTRADNVPYDTLVRAFDARQSAADASQKIASDPQLSTDQKRAELKNLATQSRTRLLSTLGPGAGPAYADSARWLTGLEQGRIFSIMPDGNISMRGITIPRPATPTPAR
jgi:hypothetical protein